MINEERVILMTKIASYEKGPGQKNVLIGNFFRSDYIGFQVLKSVIFATIAFFIFFGLYAFYNFEILMQEIYKMDLLTMGKDIIFLYLAMIGVYGIISYIVYTYRYNMAKKSLRIYQENLRGLSQMYNDKQ